MTPAHRPDDLESALALLTPQSIPHVAAGSRPTVGVLQDALLVTLASVVSDPMLYGISSGRAQAINHSGQAVHNQKLSEGSDPSEAFRRDPSGILTRLRPTGSGTATVLDLNGAAIATGSETDIDEATGEFRMFPVVWSTDGTPTRLPLAPGSAIQGGAAINEAGVVVGVGQAPRRALRWDTDGAHVLPSGTATSSAALDVNDVGVAVGWIAEGASMLPVTWSAAGLTRLSLPTGAVEGTAAGINNVGQVVGQAVYKDAVGTVTRSDAVLWSVSSVPTVLPGLGFGMAVKINEAGVAAGWTSSVVSGAEYGPVIWAGGERISVPLGDGADAGPPWGFVDDLNLDQLAGVGNPDGHDNHDQAALWSFTGMVRFNFSGFFAPTKNPGPAAPYVVNRRKAGSAAPIKFSLSGNQGLNVLAAGNPRSKQVACTLADNDGGQPTNSVGGGLVYDRGADRYRYIWKTEKAWAGTCRQLMVELTDGTVHTALFRFDNQLRSRLSA